MKAKQTHLARRMGTTAGRLTSWPARDNPGLWDFRSLGGVFSLRNTFCVWELRRHLVV